MRLKFTPLKKTAISVKIVRGSGSLTAFTDFLLRKLKLADQDATKPEVRSRYGYLEGWVSIVGNFLLFIIKIVIGVMIDSISLIADAFHTLSDLVTSIVVVVGFKIARKPADKDHPFGHGRMENVATLIIAVLLCVVGADFFKTAVSRLMQPPVVGGNILIIVVLAVSAYLKEWMARFSFELGRRIKSSTLDADAWHHRSDAIATVLVVFAVMGALFRIFWLDALFGGMVAVIIIFTGLKLIKDSVGHLLGKAADLELIERIRKITQAVNGVEGVHDIVAHDYGTHKAISLHVEVSRSLDSVSAHRIATSVETKIAQNINSSPIVHIDLKRKKGKTLVSGMEIVEKIIKAYAQIINFHGTQISSNESGDFLTLHIVVPRRMSVEESHALEHNLRQSLNESEYFKEYNIGIHIEPCQSKCDVCSQLCKTDSRK